MSNNNESFIRWQGRLLDQRASMSNLMLGISVATLGYQINLVFADHFCFVGLDKFYYCISIFAILISVLLGFGQGFTRLVDYNLTARIARWRNKNKKNEIIKIRKKASKYGYMTKLLFGMQTMAMIIGFMTIGGFYFVRFYCKFL